MKRPVLALALVLLATCGTSKSHRTPAADQTTTTTATTSMASTTSSTPSPPPAPPAEPRIERVLADLLQRRNQLFAAPDPAGADGYLAAQCPCYDQERTSLATLRDKGWHWTTPMFDVVGVRVADRKQADLVTLTAVVRRPPERVVDQTGNLATPEGPGLEPTGYSFLLTRQGESWKIADNFKLDLPADMIRQIMAEGVPK